MGPGMPTETQTRGFMFFYPMEWCEIPVQSASLEVTLDSSGTPVQISFTDVSVTPVAHVAAIRGEEATASDFKACVDGVAERMGGEAFLEGGTLMYVLDEGEAAMDVEPRYSTAVVYRLGRVVARSMPHFTPLTTPVVCE